MNEKTVVEVLQKARALISKPENWCQHVSKQRNNTGAMSYCVMGAVNEASHWHCVVSFEPEIHLACVLALRDAGGFSPIMTIPKYNDTHTHAEVLALFDKAIAANQ